jgi:hypothetical protein
MPIDLLEEDNIKDIPMRSQEEQPSKEAIQEYLHDITVLARTESKAVFQNSTHVHACAVLATMLKYSQKEMYIYDTSFKGDVVDSLPEVFYPALKEYLTAGKTIKMVMRDDTPCTSNAYIQFRELSSRFKNLEIRKVEPEFSSKISALYGRDINFAVGLPNSFRMEETGHDDETSRAAMCSFNRPEYSNTLSKAFSDMYSICKAFVFKTEITAA